MSSVNDTLAREVLDVWFADATRDAEHARARNRIWFDADPQLDAAIASRFGALPQQAADGALDAWAAAPHTALARILVLDQFPRNLYRGDARAHAFDAAALTAARAAVDAGFDAQLHPLQAAFVYLPFEHAEAIDAQERAVALFDALVPRAPAGTEALFASFADYARRHRAVIARFGRFPHRNAQLGRPSTPEEAAYLADGGEVFGPR